MTRWRAISREHAEARRVVDRLAAHRAARGATSPRRAKCSATPATPGWADGARRDRRRRGRPGSRSHAELQTALLPRDPDDERNAFLEMRAGTGGDEAALFAGDLLRMYLRYAERHGWKSS